MEAETLLTLIFVNCFSVFLGEKQVHSFNEELLSFLVLHNTYK